MEYQKVHIGVVVELDGKYWGIQYEDGQVTEYGFGDIERARIGDPRYAKQPTDFTYKGSPYVAELSKARLLPVTRTTIFEVTTPGGV
jgi:hypothetical protein